jgi:hypothetical protein
VPLHDGAREVEGGRSTTSTSRVFIEILDRGWEAFAPVFDPDGSKTKREATPWLAGILELRNRIMHPVRQSAQRITGSDISRLDGLVSDVDRAMEIAENIDMEDRR